MRRAATWTIGAVLLLVVLVALAPALVSGYWSVRSSNPVRRGVALAGELGCFHCHGELGRSGIPIPQEEKGVPSWSGGVWMMYVENEGEIRDFIMNGSEGEHGDDSGESHQHRPAAITMPAYKDLIDGGDLDDLVAAFKVLSGMSRPPAGSQAGRGYELARTWRCMSCHGPGGSGGRPNPGSLTGFIPGWYGPDFGDLVRDRGEFDRWIREGSIPRLERQAVASFFLRRQRVPMPAYSQLTEAQLDDLWAYVEWLEETEGGVTAPAAPW